jgi:transposase-like protein
MARTDVPSGSADARALRRFCDGLYHPEIRGVLCSTNAIKALNARV